jgi:hypothetical protein
MDTSDLDYPEPSAGDTIIVPDHTMVVKHEVPGH